MVCSSGRRHIASRSLKGKNTDAGLHTRMNDFIINLAADKKNHIIAGVIIGAICMLPTLFFSDYITLVGGVIAILIVGGKEVVYDWGLNKGNSEWLDFIASAIPILLFMLFSI
jgi:hypothetical protein